MTELTAYLEEYGAAALDRQWRLAERVGEAGWSFSLHQGRLTFTNGDVFTVQVLGTVSELSGTWRWAWANKASGIPAALLHAALELQAWGEARALTGWMRPQSDTNEFDPDAVALIASGVWGALGYYRAPYAGGALYLLLERGPELPTPELPAAHVVEVFTQLISLFDLNHRYALEGYARRMGWPMEQNGTALELQVGNQWLTGTFDSTGRLEGFQYADSRVVGGQLGSCG
ncbi:hypothetical protein HNR42_003206 [Deinobacterium chartae]|uniref:Uncharacterized protein n=1 Tax=Deinobacterium chartae TaxID=521158 RepID=A0A841I5M6_9DEIO|nr:DUF6882 domain-containing protein [Deinobacterium chartae]MBB6099748.1 hypothetical protein [Deinobacterium chartae]